MITEGVSCHVCRKQRDPKNIHPRESRLLRGHMLHVCNTCEADQKEPRAFIILVAKARGLDAVKDYLKKHRYVGPTIEGKEII